MLKKVYRSSIEKPYAKWDGFRRCRWSVLRTRLMSVKLIRAHKLNKEEVCY